MKKLSALLIASLTAIFVLAEDAKKSPPPTSMAPKADAAGAMPVLTAAMAKITAPLELKDGAIGQAETSELTDGGKAVFEFTVPKAGTYVIHAVVNATAEDANSFFLNIDAPPEDPLMIWDINVTQGFQERVVSWRGSGDADNDEFQPKKFNLTAGAHKIFLVGREPAQLKSLQLKLMN